MSRFDIGRHEHGQNFLAHRLSIERIVDLVRDTDGPIVEIGAGRGALTHELARLDRPLTAVEIDGSHARTLARDLPGTRIVEADFLQWKLPSEPHVLVGNLPFHLTTAILRKLLRSPHWTSAVLLAQWEVARRRAGVGGASMMTAQWWPWVEYSLVSRVPREGFRPRPGVDGGLFTMTRRDEPLVEHADQQAYRQFVHAVFTSGGHGLKAIVTGVTGGSAAKSLKRWFADEGVSPGALPKDLTAEQWASLFRLTQRDRFPATPRRRSRGRRTIHRRR